VVWDYKCHTCVNHRWLYARNHEVCEGPPPLDIIIGSFAHPFVSRIAWRLARKIGRRYVFEIIGLCPGLLDESGRRTRRYLFVLLLAGIERVSMWKTDSVVTILPNAYSCLPSWPQFGTALLQ